MSDELHSVLESQGCQRQPLPTGLPKTPISAWKTADGLFFQVQQERQAIAFLMPFTGVPPEQGQLLAAQLTIRLPFSKWSAVSLSIQPDRIATPSLLGVWFLFEPKVGWSEVVTQWLREISVAALAVTSQAQSQALAALERNPLQLMH